MSFSFSIELDVIMLHNFLQSEWFKEYKIFSYDLHPHWSAHLDEIWECQRAMCRANQFILPSLWLRPKEQTPWNLLPTSNSAQLLTDIEAFMDDNYSNPNDKGKKIKFSKIFHGNISFTKSVLKVLSLYQIFTPLHTR